MFVGVSSTVGAGALMLGPETVKGAGILDVMVTASVLMVVGLMEEEGAWAVSVLVSVVGLEVEQETSEVPNLKNCHLQWWLDDGSSKDLLLSMYYVVPNHDKLHEDGGRGNHSHGSSCWIDCADNKFF